MARYSAMFSNSGEALGEFGSKEELFSFLDSNRAIYNEADFATDAGVVEVSVENPDNLDYIDNIFITW